MPFSRGESIERQEFREIDCRSDLEDISFYECVFRDCSFQSRRLSDCVFDECEFVRCNLSLVEMAGAVFTGATFTDCKLLGLNWSGTGGFLSAAYTGCLMENNLFADMNLSRFRFTSCLLANSAFSNTKLRQAVFDDCDLAQCQFHQTDLTEADFRTARNYYMNAETNRLRKTRFSLPEAVSLLANLNIVLE
ncbi:pentapeptide repeat-containing protein [Salidesulfovibrio onnuriiensis]|uniref:pentapeptide repeat-containing protein n=1 Tax=Salidesulfovibrio onnuriiensis TaxID=2583823 RepID=UPI0011C99A27|nr:pentapeptide repeat-containing protein [Salidesulfovibrio onnuriiensis]